MMRRLFGENKPSGEQGGHWISVSDLMAGLMMVFLFIAIAHMRHEQEQRNRIREIAVAYQTTQVHLYEELQQEFEKDLPKWNAELDQASLALRFKSPDVLFDSGRAQVKDSFKRILSDFFPRYIEVLKRFKDDIAEIRIEGHTSSFWGGAKSELEAYFCNMRLSQDRTRSVLEYCLTLDDVAGELSWARNLVTANGLSSSKLRLKNGVEDRCASRRVEFRVRTKAETRIMKIIEEAK